MKLKYITFLFLSLFVFYSCLDDNTTSTSTSGSKDAQIYSFSLSAIHLKQGDSVSRALDSLRFIQFNKTKFAIDNVNNLIYNPDSLPYGLKLQNVKMTLTVSSAGASQLQIITPDSTYAWNNSDSVNFSKDLELKVTAVDANITKTYRVDIRIHQIDPDTILWNAMGTLPAASPDGKVLLANDLFYSYSSALTGVSLYTSDVSALSWQQQTVSGLPNTADLSSVTFLNNAFYAITKDGDSYSSPDGKVWTKQNNGFNLVSLFGVLPGTTSGSDQLLVSITEGGKYYYGVGSSLSEITKVTKITSSPSDNSIKSGFPLSQFGTVTNLSSNRYSNVLLLVGGLDMNQQELNATWVVRQTSEGIELSSSSKNFLFMGGGLSSFFYDEKLYTFAKNKFYISSSWGEEWIAAPRKQSLDTKITSRKNQSIIVDNKNNIWIFGGATNAGLSLNDVWKGRLNKLNVK